MLNFGSEQMIGTERGQFRLAKLRLKYIREFRDWIAARIGDPFAAAERLVNKLPPAEAMQLVREAEDVKRQLDSFSIGSELAQRWLCHEEGLAFLVGVLLREHHPQADEDDVLAVCEVVAGQIIDVLVKAMGSLPNDPGPAPGDVSAESTGTGSTVPSGIGAPD